MYTFSVMIYNRGGARMPIRGQALRRGRRGSIQEPRQKWRIAQNFAKVRFLLKQGFKVPCLPGEFENLGVTVKENCKLWIFIDENLPLPFLESNFMNTVGATVQLWALHAYCSGPNKAPFPIRGATTVHWLKIHLPWIKFNSYQHVSYNFSKLWWASHAHESLGPSRWWRFLSKIVKTLTLQK